MRFLSKGTITKLLSALEGKELIFFLSRVQQLTESILLSKWNGNPKQVPKLSLVGLDSVAFGHHYFQSGALGLQSLGLCCKPQAQEEPGERTTLLSRTVHSCLMSRGESVHLAREEWTSRETWTVELEGRDGVSMTIEAWLRNETVKIGAWRQLQHLVES